MGYRVDRYAVIELDNFPGAEARVRIGVPLGVIRAFQEAPDAAAEWAIVADLIDNWNLEDEDGPIPVTEAMERVPMPELRALMAAWFTATVNPPAPLSQPSGDTATSPEA